jgi:hypothetical protein
MKKAMLRTSVNDLESFAFVAAANIGFLQHHSVIFSVQSQALSACRAREIPIAYLSPEMLQQKLVELEKSLPEDLSLAWDSDNAMKYYKMNSADCTFDDDGGLIQVEVRLL